MPLSEHEERVLAEIERQLAAEDPGFVARARRSTRTQPPSPRAPGRTRVVAAGAGVVLGLLSLLALTFHIAFGLVGFAVLLGSLTVLVQALRDEAAVRTRGRGDTDEPGDGRGRHAGG